MKSRKTEEKQQKTTQGKRRLQSPRGKKLLVQRGLTTQPVPLSGLLAVVQTENRYDRRDMETGEIKSSHAHTAVSLSLSSTCMLCV